MSWGTAVRQKKVARKPSAGWCRHIRNKKAADRAKAFEQAQEERVRARSAEQAAKKKRPTAAPPSVRPLVSVAPVPSVPVKARSWWTCHATAKTAYYMGPCNELNPSDQDNCAYCGAPRPNI